MSQSLQARNTRSLLTWLPVVMLAGSVFLYLILMGHIRHMKHQQLVLKQNNVWNAFVSDTGRTAPQLAGEYQITTGSVNEDITADSGNLEYLAQTHRLRGRPYIVKTYISAKEYRHLLIKTGLAEAVIFIVLLIAIFVVNRVESRRVWRPFFNTMALVRRYDIRRADSISLETSTGIGEFDRLNQTLTSLIDHVGLAYTNQKQFTENASHELQTPLAIIRSKVELLSESPGINEDSAQLLQEIAEANERLSQMNKNLLLLTRIDNAPYPEVERVHISGLIHRLVEFFKDYYASEGITTTANLPGGVTVTANPALIEILANNLLRNAYIHNIPCGWVDIQLSDKQLVISNSGPAIDGDPRVLFDRFRKGRVDNRTTGLGLALVRQIAQLYHYSVDYTYETGIHRLCVVIAPAGS